MTDLARARHQYAEVGATPFLSVRNLRKSYGNRNAVDGVTFHIDSGECYGLLGPNGAGKTTTILSICGLVTPDSGDLRIGQSGSSPTSRRARRDIGYVPQDIALYDDLSGRENLRFFGKLYGLRGRALAGRVDDVLAFVGLVSRADEKVAAYSGGMKRRVNIAAALLHEPGLLVLDEPTVGIDPQSRNAILEQLQALRSEGVAVLYTSHYMEEVEQISDRIGIMDEGRILAEGTSRALLGVLGEVNQKVHLVTGSSPTQDLLDELALLENVVSAQATPDGPAVVVTEVAQALPAVLALLGKLEVGLLRLSVEAPDLEDVFLHLTGRALRDG